MCQIGVTISHFLYFFISLAQALHKHQQTTAQLWTYIKNNKIKKYIELWERLSEST